MEDRITPHARDQRRSSTSGYWHPNKWAKTWIARGVPKHLHITLVALADAFDRTDGYVWQTQHRMAVAWGIPERTFRRHLGELEKLGAIERQKRHRKQGPLAGTRAADRIYFRVPLTGHNDGRLSDSQSATAVTPTSGHDGGRADVSSEVPSTDGPLAPLGDIAASAADPVCSVTGDRDDARCANPTTTTHGQRNSSARVMENAWR
ncbi:MAG TPA: hypothetical protein VM582_10090, partial [Candidatus Thermoplasmatota archaeon]|nr:hypothetical protein [Candidatus Thermoplasmatota archaeon]